jgi:hypothetical protein
MSQPFVELPPMQANIFKAICLESGFNAQVFYPDQKGAARRIYVNASAQDMSTLEELFAEKYGTAIL